MKLTANLLDPVVTLDVNSATSNDHTAAIKAVAHSSQFDAELAAFANDLDLTSEKDKRTRGDVVKRFWNGPIGEKLSVKFVIAPKAPVDPRYEYLVFGVEKDGRMDVRGACRFRTCINRRPVAGEALDIIVEPVAVAATGEQRLDIVLLSR